uniref:Superoxide dismutase Cu-Zn n=1 Tax=Rhizophora mucronata TaxID=61149 RepID=A0A2P2LVC3_RHIMU
MFECLTRCCTCLIKGCEFVSLGCQDIMSVIHRWLGAVVPSKFLWSSYYTFEQALQVPIPSSSGF